MGCFIGCKPPSTGLFLVCDRLIANWQRNGGKYLRKADPSIDGDTDRWLPLRTARQRLAASIDKPIEAVADTIEPIIPRKRGRPRKGED